MEDSASWQLMITWAVLIAAGAMLLARLAMIANAKKWRSERPPRRDVDISHLNTPPPDSLRASIAEMEALGFQRLGELQVEEPEKGPIGQVWTFVNAEGTVLGEIAASAPQPLSGFMTAFADGAITEVFYPHGESIDHPDYVHHYSNVSLADAYRRQCEQVAAFYEAHGAPRPIRTMQDCLDMSALYRERYSQRLMGSVMRSLTLAPLVANLVVLALAAGLLIAQYRFDMPQWAFLSALGVIGAITFTWVIPRLRTR